MSATETTDEPTAPAVDAAAHEPAPTAAATPGPSRRDRLIAVGVPTFVVALHASVYGPWIEDDAGITFAYARSLATGAGPVLQPGAEAVEGFSNPTWLGILVLGRWAGLFDHGTWFGVPDLSLFPKLVALLCAALTFSVMFGVLREVSRRPALLTAAAGTITALVPSYVVWSMSGLENALYALLVVALGATLARAALRGRLLDPRTAMIAGLLAGFAALTRPDGLIYLAAHPLVVGLVRQGEGRARLRAAARAVGIGLVPVGLYVLIRLAVFGDWLPNTARAKGQGLPGIGDLGRPIGLIQYAGWLTVLLVVVAVVLAVRRHSPTRTAIGVLLVPTALSVVAFVVLPADWMEQYRFATPLWPLGALVAVLAVAGLPVRWTRRSAGAAALASVLAVLLTGGVWIGSATAYQRNPTAPLCFVAQSVGQRVNQYADVLGVRDGSLLAVDGGGTALTSRLRFVDLSGLTDRRFAELWQQGDAGGVRDLVFDDVRPTFFKVDSGWAGAANAGLLRDPRLARDYVLLFSPKPGSGTWVRRDAVPDDQRLATAQRLARYGFTQEDIPFLTGDRTAWTCGSTLRPNS